MPKSTKSGKLVKNYCFVSIVIPTLNEENNIKTCLTSINRMKIGKDMYEIIVVDNGSQDRTLEVAKTFNVRILSKPCVNISALRNLGVKIAKGNILAFVDADCAVSENWLKYALPYFERPITIGAVGSKYKIPENATWVGRAWNLKYNKKQNYTGEIEWLSGGNIIVSRESFNSVMGFDENLATNEDYDFCFRLREKGYKIVSDANISSYHYGIPQKLKDVYKKQSWHGKEVFRVFLKDIKKLKNFRAVLFALFYAFCILGVLVSLLIALTTKNLFPLVFFVLAPLFVPFIMATITVYLQKQYRYLFGLTLVYLVYGLARAMCVLKLHDWLFNKSCKSDFL